MTGGYNNTPPCFLGGNAEAYYRGWSCFGAEVYLDSIAGDYLGSRGSEVFGGKAGVKANNDALSGQPCLFQVVGYCLGTYPYVIEGKILGNNPPPAVSAELNEIVYSASSPLLLLCYLPSASFLKISALSVFSQGRSRSFRPKCP